MKTAQRTYSAGETFPHWDGGTIRVLGAGPMGCTVAYIGVDGTPGQVSQVSHAWLTRQLKAA